MAKANLDEYKGFLREELTPAQNRGFYICPLCGSGNGQHRTAALSIEQNGEHWKCFSCGEGGDIFDLFAKRDGLTTAEAIKAVQAKYITGGGFAPRPAPASRSLSRSSLPSPLPLYLSLITILVISPSSNITERPA